jgi:ArsR family transcriptional regulator
LLVVSSSPKTSGLKALELARLFTALSDPTRLRLLHMMNGREVCVCDFVTALRLPQPKISRHLAYLRGAGVVSARREGKWVHYRIVKPSDPEALCILECTLSTLSSVSELNADLVCIGGDCC